MALTTLDGLPFTSGTLVAAEGAHTLVVSAMDGAGNPASKTVSFTLDFTPPVVTVSGVVDGQLGNQPVTPVFSASDAHPGSTSATLDGAAFTSGTTVTAEGLHTLVVTSTDGASNPTTVTVRFTIDTTPPVITLTGVTDGELINHAVTPVFSSPDPRLAFLSATLDGSAFTSGTTVSSEGEHHLLVTATDTAGNPATLPVTFTLDFTPPALHLTVLTSNAVYSAPVTPTWSQTELHPGPLLATLDGATVASGSTFSTEGVHTFVLSTTDLAGNPASLTVPFTLDFTAPVVTVTGVTDGASGTSFTPVFSATDLTTVTLTATLDGSPFTSGTPVTGLGTHVLVVTATDAATHVTTVSDTFTVVPLIIDAGTPDAGPPPIDAGQPPVDAGVPDAGSTDAGVDAGVDGGVCLTGEVVARRDYAPSKWTDGTFVAPAPFRMMVPATLAVTKGNAGNKEAWLTRIRSASTVLDRLSFDVSDRLSLP